jgi:filamentous hemagglutinin family protein
MLRLYILRSRTYLWGPSALACLLLQLLWFLIFHTDGSAFALTPPITPSGLHTQISGPIAVDGKTQFDITGGTRPGGGVNLFHSFGQFNVPPNNIANFLNGASYDLNGVQLPPGLLTSNILARVTGTDGNHPTLSSIYGAIQTTGFGTANLFLMNPAGFLIGPNATVNVGGMLTFTTADYLRLYNGITNGYFYGDPAGPSLLTAAPVAAFGFLGSNAASIAIQGGTLEVPDGKTLSFIGGPRPFTTDTGVAVPAGVTMTGGSLSAPNGLIYMATVTSPGEIPIPTLSGAPLGPLGSPSSDPAVIRIRSGEFVMDHAFLTATNTSDAVQSAIEVTVQGMMTLRNASSISTETFSAGQGSDLHIAAQSLQMDGSSIKSITTGDGRGGDISIGGQTISLTNGAQIVNSTAGTGTGGDVNLVATDTVLVSGFDTTGSLNGVSVLVVDQNTGLPAVTSGVFSLTSSSERGGQINLYAPAAAVTLQNGGTIATIASGDGSGGNIAIESKTIDVTNGGQIVSFTGADLSIPELTGGIGPGGNITVSAQDSIVLSGFSLDLNIPSSISSQTFGAGKGGDITTSAPTTNLVSGGQLVASNFTGEAPTGNISVSAPSSLLISGSNPLGFSQIQAATGSISVTAGSVTLTDQAFVSTGGTIAFQVQNDLNITAGGSIKTSGGAIGINADQVVISGEVLGSPSQIASLASGDTADDITLHVRNLLITDRGLITKETEGAGQTAAVIINAESVTVADLGKIIMFNGHGPGGLLEIKASNIALNQGLLSTTASGTGDAGVINLVGDNVSLTNSRISSPTNGGTARGGDVTITATNSLTITGLFTDDSGITSPSGILARTADGMGDGGNVTINAGNIEISGGGQINSSSFSPGHAGNVTIEGTERPAQSVVIDGLGSGVFTDTQGTGAGGNIFVNANSVTLQNGGALSAATSGTADSALGGTITVDATNTVTMNSASIRASSTGTADAGSIDITANNGFTMQNSSITTQVTPSATPGQSSAGGGDIKITTSNAATVELVNSKIIASVADGPGGGGNISIDPQFVILLNSQILAQAAQGQGGAITITTSLFLPDANSIVNADSDSGVNGTVTIQSPNAPISGQIQPLGKTPLLATSLLNQHCASLADGQFSSFTVGGRDSVPTEPGGWLASPLALGHAEFSAGAVAEGDTPMRVIDPAHETTILSLRQIAPAGFLTQAFAVDWSASCQS